MALIEFQDLPNITTPINAQNLNNNFSELDEKSDKHIITAIGSEITTGLNTYDKIPLTEKNKTGNKLSINNGGVKIGNGVSYVKVSASILFSKVINSTTRHHLQIYKNSSSLYDFIQRFSGNWESITSNELLIPVVENDIIYLYVRTQDTAGSITSASYLTVEAVE